ncbi:MAG: HNH endonuclease [Candidatus Eisenbacteria sp.]|nr:HNH endonuclease [Candidatus Eisenbacteria bacterium]
MLNSPALVLNRGWYPIGTTTVRDAICLVFREAAKALDHQDCSIHDFDSWTSLSVARGEPCIRTVRLSIRIPEVIILTRYDAIPHHRVPFSRRNIYKRDRYRCQYCGARPPVAELTVDHVVPRSMGGRSTWKNCVLACLRCNRRKASRTLSDARLRLRVSPREPHWSPCISIPVAKRRASWEQFVSEKYWNVELDE